MNVNKVFIFIAGAAIGSLVTWKFVEEKYKRIADEEIASVIEQFKNREETFEQTPIKEGITNEEKSEYNDHVKDLGYSDNEEDYIVKSVPAQVEHTEPYVIAPEEYGEELGFRTESWVYYADGVLADENDQPITNPEHYIGDGLEHFGEYEDDSVHVRDEDGRCDYEILRSEKTFNEVYKEEI